MDTQQLTNLINGGICLLIRKELGLRDLCYVHHEYVYVYYIVIEVPKPCIIMELATIVRLPTLFEHTIANSLCRNLSLFDALYILVLL